MLLYRWSDRRIHLCVAILSNRFTNGNGHPDSKWLASLDRVDAPLSPAPPSPAPPSASSPPPSARVPPSPVPPAAIHAPKPQAAVTSPLPTVTSPTSDNKERDDLRALIQDQARAIASLEVEKSSLLASVEQLNQLETSEYYYFNSFLRQRLTYQQSCSKQVISYGQNKARLRNCRGSCSMRSRTLSS